MDFSEFEKEVKKYRSSKLTQKDIERLEQDMIYVTALFLASQGIDNKKKALSNALDFSCCDSLTYCFRTLLMGDEKTDKKGISAPTSMAVKQYCLAREENEAVKMKDKTSSLLKAFKHIPRFGIREGTRDEQYETAYYEIAIDRTIAFLQKNKSFIKDYYEYIFQKHPELDKNDRALIIHPMSDDLADSVYEDLMNHKTGNRLLNEEAQLSLKYKKVVSLLIHELENYYQDKPEYRDVIISNYHKALQESLRIRENRIKSDSIYRITNVIEFLGYTGYLDEIVAQNNERALKYGLYPYLLSITENDNVDHLVPKGKLDAIAHKTSAVRADDYALFSAFCLLNPDWKNKTMEEQANMTIKKACFPIQKLLDEKYYQDFSVEELLVCSAFYINRLEKISERLMRGAFLHDKLNTLYDSVETGEIPDSASDRMPDVLKQRSFMLDLVKDKFVEVWKSTGFVVDSWIDPEAEKRVREQEIAMVPNEIEEKYQEVYQKYFSVYLKDVKHDLTDDYIYFFKVRNLSQILYIIKDMSLESLMMMFASGKSKTNFGLIPEEQETVNEYGEPQVLLGIDCENMPTVRLHYPKSEFERVKEEYYGDKEFPIYFRPNDLKIGEKEMTTPLVYKFTKGAKQLHHKMYSGMSKDALTYNLMRRTYWNMHPNQSPLNSSKKEVRALVQKKDSNNPDI